MTRWLPLVPVLVALLACAQPARTAALRPALVQRVEAYWSLRQAKNLPGLY